MALSNSQKDYIKKHYGYTKAKKIAAKLKTDQSLVEEYINTLPPKKTPVIFYIMAVILPLLFFVLLEIVLRISGYGNNYEQWVEVPGEKLLLNPDVAKRYFYNTENVPNSNKDTFDKIKAKNSIRIFIMGGSSAAGYPYSPSGSFSKYIKKRLEIMYPYNKIEVINTAMTAVNSYTLLDLTPGIIEQKPDVVIIYAGHNEYYGALGVGSMETFGTSRSLVLLNMSLNNLRTYQLLRNVVKGVYSLFTEDDIQRGGTLMSRMAKEQSITLNSETFNAGVDQFSENIEDIFKQFQDAGIPVVIGTLASNLKDQPPFITVSEEGQPDGISVYKNALKALKDSNFVKADSLFRYAKDLDALRFRAPEIFNTKIEEISTKYNIPVANVDSLVNSVSPEGIAGNNIMVDHLHLTLGGYQKIGNLFFHTMLNSGYLPGLDRVNLPEQVADSLVVNNYNFTYIDSAMAQYRIIILKSDWPYTDKAVSTREIVKRFNLKSHKDTLALSVIDNKLDWEEAHRKAAEDEIKNGNVNKFIEHYNTLLFQYPNILDYYNIAAEQLLQYKYYNEAHDLLLKKYKIRQDFFTLKWLGIISLNRGEIIRSIDYLERAVKLNSTDAQTWYNLSGAYLQNKQYEDALVSINNCLRIEPEFGGAERLKQGLEKVVK